MPYSCCHAEEPFLFAILFYSVLSPHFPRNFHIPKGAFRRRARRGFASFTLFPCRCYIDADHKYRESHAQEWNIVPLEGQVQCFALTMNTDFIKGIFCAINFFRSKLHCTRQTVPIPKRRHFLHLLKRFPNHLPQIIYRTPPWGFHTLYRRIHILSG